MEFPKNNDELDEIFLAAISPTIEELSGDFSVDVLTGIVPSFRFVGHKKWLNTAAEPKTGYNYFLKCVRFGNFSIELGTSEDFHDLRVVVLNYTDKGNIFMHLIRDKLRRVDDGIYLGRYYLLHRGAFEFAGYFSMVQAKRTVT